MFRSLSVLVLVPGCLAVGQVAPLPAPPPPQTAADLAGPLCEGGECACRETAPKIAQKAPGARLKRYEIRLGPSQNELWAKIGNEVLYKDRDRAVACFYVDLAPGEHPVMLQAKQEHGVAVKMEVAEMGGGGKWFYESFVFDCGAPGLCTREHLDAFKARAASANENNHAPCGTTTVRNIHWRTGRAPDGIHPAAFVLSLTLRVSERAPEYPPGDPACAQ